MINKITKRLQLTPCQSEHFADIYKYSSDGSLYEYLEYDRFQNYDEFFEWIINKAYSSILIAIILHGENRCIGTISISDVDTKRRSCSIGYALDQGLTGHGYFSEALEGLLFELKVLNFKRVWAVTQHNNERSVRSLLRSGFEKEGLLGNYYYAKGMFYDAFLLSVILD